MFVCLFFPESMHHLTLFYNINALPPNFFLNFKVEEGTQSKRECRYTDTLGVKGR